MARDSRTRPRRRAARALAVVVGTAVLLPAGVAQADPAGPTHYRAVVEEVVADDGAAPGIDVRVLGGDAFLVVEAPAGTTVEVPGYEGEPFLRIGGDGGIERNTRSPARWLNDARYGAIEVAIPPEADAMAPPTWERVADGGRYAWHDHRIHFMSPTVPSHVDTAAGTVQHVMDWVVPLRVDGRDVEVVGVLSWLPGPAPALPLGSVAVVMFLGTVLALRVARLLPAAIGATALLTGAVGASQHVGLPAGADADAALVVLPALALVVLGAALLVRRRAGPSPGTGVGAPEAVPPLDRAGWLVVLAGFPIGVVGVLGSGALWRPIVPGPLHVGIVRFVVATALVVGFASVVLLGQAVLRSAAFTLAPDVPQPES